jgi:hypothetical protein
MSLSTWPNPATDLLQVRYRLEQAARVSITLVDPLGRVALRRDVGSRTEGEHVLSLDAVDLPAGVYRMVLNSSANDAKPTTVSIPVTIVR